jgi:uncharacterized protein YdhG (YjbR/CyaY superfamily)
MERERKNWPDIESYIADFPENTRSLLEKVRETIKNVVPEAEEVISYQMPAFKYHGILVWFAGYKNHIGFYPAASGIQKFKNELSGYKGAKGSVQFPIDKPLPLDLIKKIVEFRVTENLLKSTAKKSTKPNTKSK